MTTYTPPNKLTTDWPPFGLAQWPPFGLTKALSATFERSEDTDS
jgi:hypothetical protein